jgi:hypothetical protein
LWKTSTTIRDVIGRLIATARHIKESAEWYAILAGAGLLPTATVITGVVNGAPLDILLLYLMAAVAYGFVIFTELPEVIRQLHRPELILEFTPACCKVLVGERDWNQEAFLVGIRNASRKTIRDVRVKVLDVNSVSEDGRLMTVRADLPASLEPVQEIHPSGDTHTVHVRLAVYGPPGTEWLSLQTVPSYEIPRGDYFGTLRIEAQDATPIDVSFRLLTAGPYPVLNIG